MRTRTLACYMILLGFTCFVFATEGPTRDMGYIVFTLMLIVIPISTVFVIRRTARVRRSNATIHTLAGLFNVLLLAKVCWALVDQYPHPKEHGVVPFAVLSVVTPILSAVVLLHCSPSGVSPSR